MDFKKENLKRQDYYVMKTGDYNSEYTPSEKGVLIVSKFYNKSNPQEFWVKVYGGDFLKNTSEKIIPLRIYLHVICDNGFLICDSDKKILTIEQLLTIIKRAKEVEYE